MRPDTVFSRGAEWSRLADLDGSVFYDGAEEFKTMSGNGFHFVNAVFEPAIEIEGRVANLESLLAGVTRDGDDLTLPGDLTAVHLNATRRITADADNNGTGDIHGINVVVRNVRATGDLVADSDGDGHGDVSGENVRADRDVAADSDGNFTGELNGVSVNAISVNVTGDVFARDLVASRDTRIAEDLVVSGGTATITSPLGHASLSVLDTGVFLVGPDGTLELTANGVEIEGTPRTVIHGGNVFLGAPFGAACFDGVAVVGSGVTTVLPFGPTFVSDGSRRVFACLAL